MTYLWTRSPDCQILEIDLQIFLQISRVGLQIDKSLDLIPRIDRPISNPRNRSPDHPRIIPMYCTHAPLCCKSLDCVSGSNLRKRCPDIESKIAGDLSYWTMISCGHNNEVKVFPASCLLLSPGGYRGQKYLGQQTTTAAG